MLQRALDLNGFFGMALSMGNGHKIWYIECKESVYRAGSLTTAAVKCKLDDSVEVQEIGQHSWYSDWLHA
jgi:hypothetical protein